MNRINRNGVRTWIEIDKKAIKSNFLSFKKIIAPKTKLMAVVKSNAYGHDFFQFSKEMEKLGADFLGVDSVVEGLALRKAGIKLPILVLGFTLPERIKEVISNDISITISSFDQLNLILKEMSAEHAHHKLKVHIKVDTGMHRQGFSLSEQKSLISMLNATCSTLHVSGLYTHFASAKNPSFPQYTLEQINTFNKFIYEFKKAGFNPIVHASATAGTILFPQAHFDMVRIGIGLYGYFPSKETEIFAKNFLKLKPILTWKTIISEIKKIKKGEKIGYDGTEILKRDSVLAICPIGYWHGLPRSLSSAGELLVKGKRARIVGRVSMDMIVIDITGIKGVKVLDEAIIIGKTDSDEITAQEISGIIDASYYELITRINPLIKRVYL